MANEKLIVLNPEVQLGLIKGTKTRDDYFDLYPQLMCDNPDSFWCQLVREGVKKSAPPEMIQLLVLNLIQGSQHGFISMEGQELRHHRRGYKKPIFTYPPYHQFALAVYLAYHNKLAFEQRSYWQRQLVENNNPDSDAVWGIMLDIRNERVVYTDDSLEKIAKRATIRVDRQRPICLPTPELTNPLAAIGFTGEEAETIPKRVFRQRYASQFTGVLQDIIDVEPLIYSRTRITRSLLRE